jgi:preprotein translocase subunit SecD
VSSESLPRAVASGAAVLATACLLVLFVELGGATTDFARDGGLRMTWTPPAGYAAHRVVDRLTAHGTHVVIDARGDAVIDVAGVEPENVDEVAREIATRPIELHQVLETKEMLQLPRVLSLPMLARSPLDADVDAWRTANGLAFHDYYLFGARPMIDAALARAAEAGWTLPPRTHIVYQHLLEPESWRTYVVSDTVEVDADDIVAAVGARDAVTGAPAVEVELSTAAGERFGELTARIAGHKLAVVRGDEVVSAPVIDGAIRTGRASFLMGGIDRVRALHDREVIVAVLRGGALPRGGTVRAASYVAPASGELVVWLARALAALVGGALVGLGAFAAVRATRR